MPGSQSISPKDASEQLGSLNKLAVTVSQVINIFNSYIANTKLSKLLDVDASLDLAPIGSIFTKGADSKWTYDNIEEYILPPATSSVLGGVKIGNGITVDSEGLISIIFPDGYSLPVATNSVLGGVKIGSGLSIDESGVLNSTLTTPLSGMLNWDGEKYALYISKKITDPGFPYMYNGTDDPTYENRLNIDAIIFSSSYYAVNGALSGFYGPASIVLSNTPDHTFSVNSWDNMGKISTNDGRRILIGNTNYIAITDSTNFFEINCSGINLNQGTPSKWLALDSSRNIVYMDAPASSYTHPTQSIISPTLTGALVPSSIIVNTLGHITSISTRTLTLADLGYDGMTSSQFGLYDLDVVHKSGTEVISGPKTFSSTYTRFQSITAHSDSNVAIESIALGEGAFAYSGISDYVPMQLANSNTATTGHRVVAVLRGDSAHVAGDNGFGLDIAFRLPCLGWTDPVMSEIPGGLLSCVLTDNTQNYEYSEHEVWLQKAGVLTKVMWLDGNGNLTVTGSINSVSSKTVFTITLPSSGSVSGRCATAVAGIDYPIEWTIAADTNPNDLLITHGLDRRIAAVSIYTVVGASERLLYANAAYAGIIAPTSSILRIEGLATVGTPIVIHCIFA